MNRFAARNNVESQDKSDCKTPSAERDKVLATHDGIMRTFIVLHQV